jgi:N-acetylmuramoyl-L-alanine amidase
MNGNLILTAGHSLADSGAVYKNFKENMLTIELRQLIVNNLIKKGFKQGIFVDNDNLSYVDTIKWINTISTKNDYLIDIHFNAGPTNASGSEVFFDARITDKNRIKIAEDISKVMADTLKIPNRKAKPDTLTQHKRIGILRDTYPKAYLIEVCFLNENDLSKYEKNKLKLADNISDYIINNLFNQV